MKTWKIFWGIGLILAAALLLLDAFGIITPFLEVVGGISVAQVICGLFLVAFVVSRIIKLKIHEIFIPLALLFMLFEDNVAFILGLEDDNIIGNWLLFWCAVLLSIGVSILTPKRKKHKKVYKFKRSYSSKHSDREVGSSTTYIDCKNFVEEYVNTKFGESVVHFENESEYTGGAILFVSNTFGETIVYVSKEWNVKVNISNKFGEVRQEGSGNTEGPVLTIEGNNTFGETLIKFI